MIESVLVCVKSSSMQGLVVIPDNSLMHSRPYTQAVLTVVLYDLCDRVE